MHSILGFARNSCARLTGDGARFFVSDAKVSISSWRLEQLIHGEITHLSLRDPVPFSLNKILGMKDFRLVGEELSEELPVRYAHRIKLLESVPNWKEKKGIAEVRAKYIQSFKDLRTTDSTDDHAAFVDVLRRIRMRHVNTTKLVSASRHLELDETETNALLDKFFMSRISTNLLISHYLHLVDLAAAGHDNSEADVISPKCDPAEVTRQAVAEVQQLCRNLYGKAPEIRVRDRCAPLPFPPRYLHFVLFELLKNAAKATLESAVASGEDLGSKPISVVISRDEDRVAIRISDEGGGIERKEMNHIWSYQFTSSNDEPNMDSVDESLMNPGPSSYNDNTSLSGGGFGLPLAKLYVNYLGGEINLNSIPMYGTDVYIFLSPEGNSEEQVPGCSDMLSLRDIEAYQEACGLTWTKPESLKPKLSWRDTLQPEPIPSPFIATRSTRAMASRTQNQSR
eukprot:GEMP01042162.1.p1 GENE.GEMP01042162.1~~GEMP01042162.1.p1  ORF type:complete len:454 (-),score=75.43 GEMP01042162.1:197-1558(-)